MNITVRPLIIPFFVAAVSACFVSVDGWGTWRTGLVPALSVVAAAVLVRLARGLPFTNPDHFALSDFRNVSDALEKIARSLRALIFVCFSSMVGIIIFPSVLGVVRRVVEDPRIEGFADSALSSLLGFATSYAFVRVMQVVEGDISLLQLQTKILDGVISAKNAKAFETKMAAQPTTPIAGAENFGRPLQ